MSLIYPRRCEACGRNLFGHETFICNHCRITLPKSNYHQQPNNQLAMALRGRVPLSGGMSLYLFEKSGRVQRMIHAIKYQEQKELGHFLGGLYAADLHHAACVADVDLVMPVPLHRKKLRARGFNQSEWFARGLAETLKKPMDTGLLERVVDTATQTRKKKYQRWENVEGIFRLTRPEALMDKHVLLVDDVVTTGATIEAVWLAMKEVKGLRLSVASIAFASNGV